MKKRNFFQRIQKKRYESQRFKNPYFQKDDQKVKKPFLIIIFSIVGAIFIIVFILRLASTQIENVSITGLQTISQEEVSQLVIDYLGERRFLIFKQSNKLFLNQDGLRQMLDNHYAFEEFNLVIEKSVINLTLKEKTSQLLWKTDGIIYYVDLQGSLTRSLTEPELAILNGLIDESPPADGEENAIPKPPDPLTLLPIFIDLNNSKVSVGDSVLSQEEIQNIFRFHEHLLAQGISSEETRIDRLAGKWIAVRTGVGYDILFDATGDIDAQAANLETLFRETVSDTTQLDYIDLRFGDHVYYK